MLVGGDTRLLPDESEYRLGFLPAAGCTRLRCAGCKELVRVGDPGFRPLFRNGRSYLSPAEQDAAFGAASWDAVPFLEKDGSTSRLYVCRCQYVSQVEDAYVSGFGNYEPDDLSDPRRPWACDGHPVPLLPVTLGELTITATSRGEELVAPVLSGKCPRVLGAPNEGPAHWVSWLYGYLLGLPIAEEIALAMSSRLGSAEPDVSRAAISLFNRFPDAPGADRVETDSYRALTERRFSDAERLMNPFSSRVLRCASAGTMEPATWSTFEAALACEEPAISKAATETLPAFQSLGPEEMQWLADNVVRLDRVHPGRWRKLLTGMANVTIARPELGHCLVIAGMAVLDGGIASAFELQEWMHDWLLDRHADFAWRPPLEIAIESRMAAPNPKPN